MTRIADRARWYLARIEADPRRLYALLLLRNLDREHDLFWGEAALEPLCLELLLMVIELQEQGIGTSLFQDVVDPDSPMCKLTVAVLLEAEEWGADQVRIDAMSEKSMIVWMRARYGWRESMSVPTKLEAAWRGEFRRAAALGHERFQAFIRDGRRVPRWRSIEERSDGTILIALEA